MKSQGDVVIDDWSQNELAIALLLDPGRAVLQVDGDWPPKATLALSPSHQNASAKTSKSAEEKSIKTIMNDLSNSSNF
jgi:hypothetical protein